MEIIGNAKKIERFWSKVEKTEGCWNWIASTTSDGYGHFKILNKSKASHRVSFELHNQRTIGEGMVIMHSCDNRKCCNPLHLTEGTHQDNMTDMVSKGRQNPGSKRHNSKLTESQVLEIREIYAIENHKTHRQLGDEYGVSSNTISCILIKKVWKHI